MEIKWLVVYKVLPTNIDKNRRGKKAGDAWSWFDTKINVRKETRQKSIFSVNSIFLGFSKQN